MGDSDQQFAATQLREHRLRRADPEPTLLERCKTATGTSPSPASRASSAALSFAEALELTILIARKEPRRHPKVAVRWLERYVQEREPNLSDVELVVSGARCAAGEPRCGGPSAFSGD